jgi:hypothetical protein
VIAHCAGSNSTCASRVSNETAARDTPFTAASADRTGSAHPCHVMPLIVSVTALVWGLGAVDCCTAVRCAQAVPANANTTPMNARLVMSAPPLLKRLRRRIVPPEVAMTRQTWRLAAATVLTLGFLESSAFADRVSGVVSRTFVIVEDTDLVGDVTCTVEGAPCFSFGAPNAELRLNGFTITGRADATTGCAGASTTGEPGVFTNSQNGVSVRGPGLIQRFRLHGVQVAGSRDARVEHLTASTNCGSGIFVTATSFGTLVQGNLAVRNGSAVAGMPCGGV